MLDPSKYLSNHALTLLRAPSSNRGGCMHSWLTGKRRYGDGAAEMRRRGAARTPRPARELWAPQRCRIWETSGGSQRSASAPHGGLPTADLRVAEAGTRSFEHARAGTREDEWWTSRASAGAEKVIKKINK